MTRVPRLPVLLLVIAALGVFVLIPGVTGSFILDDFSNLANNPTLQPDQWTWEAIRTAIFTNYSGPLGRPVSLLTFVANAILDGFDPEVLKATNIAIHAISSILAGLLALKLLTLRPMGLSENQQRIAALLAGAAWSVHPIAVTSTLYVIQRMNLLSALFTFAAILAYLHGRQWLFQTPSRAAAWFILTCLLWILGILSKENALLLPLYLLLLEVFILQFRDSTGQLRPSWRNWSIGIATAGTILVVTTLIVTWEKWGGGYELRPFTLGERLLTEARVLWRYIGMILLPTHAQFGLFLDDITVSKGLFSPWTTLLSLAGHVALLAGLWTLRSRMPLIAFGISLFLAGHLLESTVFPLEIAFEHRNYFPAFGLLFALSVGFTYAASKLAIPVLKWLPLTAFVLYLALLTTIRSVHWADDFMLAQLEAFHHPTSARAQTRLGFEYTQFAHRTNAFGDAGWTEFYFREAATHYKGAAESDPHHRNALLLWFMHSHLLQQPFPDEAFVELVDRLENGLPRADTPSNLDSLYKCVVSGCSLPLEQVDILLNAAANNPLLRGRAASETYVVLAKYFRDVYAAPDWALYWLSSATEASPGLPRFRIYLARQLIAMDRRQEALEEIERAKGIDRMNIYGPDYRKLQSAIDQKEKN